MIAQTDAKNVMTRNIRCSVAVGRQGKLVIKRPLRGHDFARYQRLPLAGIEKNQAEIPAIVFAWVLKLVDGVHQIHPGRRIQLFLDLGPLHPKPINRIAEFLTEQESKSGNGDGLSLVEFALGMKVRDEVPPQIMPTGAGN